MSRRTAYIIVYLEVPYEEYKTKALNNRADAEIRRQVKEIARDELSFFDLDSVRDDPDDCTHKAKIKVPRAWSG